MHLARIMINIIISYIIDIFLNSMIQPMINSASYLFPHLCN